MGWLKKLFESKIDPVSLNDSNFKAEVLDFKGPCLVDVWGPGCGPCDKLAPTIFELANEYRGLVKVCELNASAAPKTMARLGVRGTPTVLAYLNGVQKTRFVGFKPKSYIQQLIEVEFGAAMTELEEGDKAGSK